ncbi:UDP-N-acetylmuramoyl-L-alanine--D-glutamate ligase [Candidatus Peregrinibacteria bacterium]|nr:UDP-N-acetylmuramoyl-L-alanine--D-glutamate ligase [Candidatus Peregrinibacteria bacterium]
MNKRSKIAILGFGVEGKAMLAYLEKHGFTEITVCDRNVDLKAELPQGVSSSLGVDYLMGLENFEVVFRSPGVRFLDPRVQLAKAKGVEVTSATKFFIDLCPCPIVGVSGTKGKGTTSTLIFEMLKKGGRKSGLNLFLGGNIGQCPVEFLDNLNRNCLVILELSSFQLQDLEKSVKYAVMLNTTVAHLDYHEDREEYMEAKEKLLVKQGTGGVAVLNKDYEYSKYYGPLVKGNLKWVSVKGDASARRERAGERGSGSASPSEAELIKNGVYVDGGKIFYAHGGKSEKIAEVSEMALVGSHNLENILPAIAVARELGVSGEACHEVIKEFKNLPHRLQFVREVGGIKFYNDSFSTVPETSMAAADSFSEPLVLIAGGYDNGADYSEWAEKILTRENLHTVILIGATSDKMEKALVEAEGRLTLKSQFGLQKNIQNLQESSKQVFPTKILRRKALEDAVIDAYAESDAGGVVVMSPAAQSFGLFKNYKQRGNDFIAHVRKLK